MEVVGSGEGELGIDAVSEGILEGVDGEAGGRGRLGTHATNNYQVIIGAHYELDNTISMSERR